MENIALSKVDVPAMAQLLKEGFPVSLWRCDDLNKLLILNSCMAWGRVQHSSLVAFVLVQMAADEAEILLLVVHPSFRRRGIAQSLLETVEHCIEQKKITRLFLEVSVENKIAIDFYADIGFEIVGTRKDYYTHKQNKSAHIMLKHL